MYKRKTATAAELSDARRRASLSRKSFKGGRPKGWRKDPNALPIKTIAVDPLDLEIIRNYANFCGKSLKDTLHHFAASLVLGCPKGIPARPQFKPEGWVHRK